MHYQCPMEGCDWHIELDEMEVLLVGVPSCPEHKVEMKVPVDTEKFVYDPVKHRVVSPGMRHFPGAHSHWVFDLEKNGYVVVPCTWMTAMMEGGSATCDICDAYESALATVWGNKE